MQAREEVTAQPTGQMEPIASQAGPTGDHGEPNSGDSTTAVYDGDTEGPMSRETAQPGGDGRVIVIGDNAARENLSEDQVPPEDGDRDGGVADGDSGPDLSQGEGRLEELAELIAKHRHRMVRAARTTVEEYIQIGEALIKAKGLCRHGRWGPFLQRCGLKKRTAEQCMRFARHRAEIERDARGTAPLTVDSVQKMLASPRKAIGQGRPPGSAMPKRPDAPGPQDRAADTAEQAQAVQAGGDSPDLTDRDPETRGDDSQSEEPNDPASATMPESAGQDQDLAEGPAHDGRPTAPLRCEPAKSTPTGDRWVASDAQEPAGVDHEGSKGHPPAHGARLLPSMSRPVDEVARCCPTCQADVSGNAVPDDAAGSQMGEAPGSIAARVAELAILKGLADPSICKREATLWYAFHAAIDRAAVDDPALREILQPDLYSPGSFGHQVPLAAVWPEPTQWAACRSCRGGHERGDGVCTGCGGKTYFYRRSARR
jgi:hypothetical protein